MQTSSLKAEQAFAIADVFTRYMLFEKKLDIAPMVDVERLDGTRDIALIGTLSRETWERAGQLLFEQFGHVRSYTLIAMAWAVEHDREKEPIASIPSTDPRRFEMVTFSYMSRDEGVSRNYRVHRENDNEHAHVTWLELLGDMQVERDFRFDLLIDRSPNPDADSAGMAHSSTPDVPGPS